MKIWSSHLLDNLSNCLMNLKNSGSWDNCLNCPASARIISSFDFKHRTSYNTSFILSLSLVFMNHKDFIIIINVVTLFSLLFSESQRGLEIAFKMLDKDGNGRLCKEEFFVVGIFLISSWKAIIVNSYIISLWTHLPLFSLFNSSKIWWIKNLLQSLWYVIKMVVNAESVWSFSFPINFNWLMSIQTFERSI